MKQQVQLPQPIHVSKKQDGTECVSSSMKQCKEGVTRPEIHHRLQPQHQEKSV